MKNLRKALALVVALAVVSVSSAAFAETINFSFNAIEGETAVVTGSYNDVAKTFTAGVTGAKAGEQSTFLILDHDAEDLNLDADDILYIDQNATGSFSGAINMTRVSDPSDNTGGTKMSAVSDLPVGTYKVKLGYYNADGAFKPATGTLTIADTAPQYTTIELVLGDVNGDNATNGTDATQILANVVGGPAKVGSSAYNIGAAIVEGVVLGDVNGDNATNGTDATQILANVVGGPAKVGSSTYNIGQKFSVNIPIK